jgi:hypothetical protein
VLSSDGETVDAVHVARPRRRDWIRSQGRANAALVLLARDMDAEFVEPSTEQEYAIVRGRTDGCTFELRVAAAADGGPVLELEVRHFHTQRVYGLDGTGCEIPGLEPQPLRAAVEDTCRQFVSSVE